MKNLTFLPVRDVKLDCEGEGVRIISDTTPTAVAPADDVRISNDAARNGEGDLLDALKG